MNPASCSDYPVLTLFFAALQYPEFVEQALMEWQTPKMPLERKCTVFSSNIDDVEGKSKDAVQEPLETFRL